jgi:hypothetical protein
MLTHHWCVAVRNTFIIGLCTWRFSDWSVFLERCSLKRPIRRSILLNIVSHKDPLGLSTATPRPLLLFWNFAVMHFIRILYTYIRVLATHLYYILYSPTYFFFLSLLLFVLLFDALKKNRFIYFKFYKCSVILRHLFPYIIMYFTYYI